MATVTDLANVAAATAAGYTLRTYTGNKSNAIAIFSRMLASEGGTTSSIHESIGESSTGNLTTAKTNALAALNAERRHKYAGAPGATSGATTVSYPDTAATAASVDAGVKA